MLVLLVSTVVPDAFTNLSDHVTDDKSIAVPSLFVHRSGIDGNSDVAR